MGRIYFDNAATTALDADVLTAMMPFLTEKFGNHSSVYSYGRETKLDIESAVRPWQRYLMPTPVKYFSPRAALKVPTPLSMQLSAIWVAGTLLRRR